MLLINLKYYIFLSIMDDLKNATRETKGKRAIATCFFFTFQRAENVLVWLPT